MNGSETGGDWGGSEVGVCLAGLVDFPWPVLALLDGCTDFTSTDSLWSDLLCD